MDIRHKKLEDIIDEKDELEAEIARLKRENRRLVGFVVLFTVFMIFRLLLQVYQTDRMIVSLHFTDSIDAYLYGIEVTHFDLSIP